MRDEQQRAFIVHQCCFKYFFGEQVKMVRRLIQNEHIGFLEHELGEETRAFSPPLSDEIF